MEVFLAWSGKTSRRVAAAIHDWLPLVNQSIEPFMSDEDVQKGTKWFTDITGHLVESSFGIVCLTQENVRAPWLHFEAGALGARLDETRVSPVLIGLEPSDVVGPLGNFQTTAFERDDFHRLVRSITDQSDRPPKPAILDKSFVSFWPELDATVSRIVQQESASSRTGPPQRSERELLEELIDLARGQQRDHARMATVRLPAPITAEHTHTARSILNDEPHAHGLPRPPSTETERETIERMLKAVRQPVLQIGFRDKEILLRPESPLTEADDSAIRAIARSRGFRLRLLKSPTPD